MRPDMPSSVESYLDAFDASWQQSVPPRLEDFLPPESDPDRKTVLVGLVRIDLERRIKGGEPARVEHYLGRYPELAKDVEAVAGLLAAEYALRRRNGPVPPPAEYARHYPAYARELLSRLLEAATANDSDVSPASTWRVPAAGAAAPVVPARVASYELLGELGRGGMGVVYKARDGRHGGLVALKTLPWADSTALYRFKQEFRALAGLSHPNLVTLYELVADGLVWCFAMELVEGADFLGHVRTEAGSAAACQEGRLRSALRQLAAGLSALHAAGRLHRDVKPSNVLVTPAGRVVILDFGLAAELGPGGVYQSTEHHLVGTVAYMAPEQAAGRPVSPASDWYSVGVMLYEALAGRLPFSGAALRILQDKQALDPPPPRELVPGVASDLEDLCLQLLQRDPEARPTGREVLARLGAEPLGPLAAGPAPADPSPRPLFVGRREQLRELADAFAAMKRGHGAVAWVEGQSGVGKSALAQEFLDGLAAGEEALILRGRCYEQESVPYKALDTLVDSLSRYLRHLPPLETQALLPRDVAQLVRVFPALGRIEAVARAPGRPSETSDPQELRRRAAAGLRELLGRLADRRPLVLFIDDLQWGDLDSAALLSELLRPPDPPALLLLGCYRSEDRSTSPFLKALFKASEEGGLPQDGRRLAVEPLSPDESRMLALSLLAPGDHDFAAPVAAIARESGGNPLFVCELVQHLRQTGPRPARGVTAAEEVSLDRVLWERIQRLSDEARRLMEVVAVSDRPLGWADACRAAGLVTEKLAVLSGLRAARLLRGRGHADQEQIEVYHDRVRETLLAHLGPDVVRHHHGRLAETLEASGREDAEVLALHFHGAGEGDRAGRYYALAARQAAETLAFDHATRLFRLALGLNTSWPVPEASGLWVGLGDALANAGRGYEAAEAYLTASRSATAAEVLELSRRAAMQYMISGHIDVGLRTFVAVLRANGMSLPRTPRLALLSLLFRRLQLRLRGLGFQRRDAAQTPPEDLARIDVCWSAVAGLTLVDPFRGMYFQTRGLLLALRAGEPYRIARGLAMEAGHVSTAGVSARARTEQLLTAADELAQEINHPYALSMVLFCRGAAEYLFGNWQTALQLCDQADEAFRARCTGVAWELDMAHTFSLWSLIPLGKLAELTRRRQALLQEAQERGDRFAMTNYNTYLMAVARLGAGDPDGAEDELNRVMGEWSRLGYHVQHHNAYLARAVIDLYRGDGVAAWEHALRQWPAYTSSLLLQIQQVRIDAVQSRARCALAAAAKASDPKPFLRSAERDARRLAREGVLWATAYGRLIRAGVAALRGQANDARMLLTGAAADFDAADMQLCAAAARRRLGQLLGGEEGRALVDQADSWMAGEQIRDPERMAATYTPG